MAAPQIPEEVAAKYPSLKKFQQEGYGEWKSGREASLLTYITQHPDIAQLHNNPTKVLNAMDDFAATQDFLINIGPHKTTVISSILEEHKPKIIVELGGYVGYSAIFFADKLRSLHGHAEGKVGGDVKVYSLEFDPEFARIAEEIIEIADLQDVVEIVVGAANQSLRQLKEEREVKHIDFLFLDHVEDLYEQDLRVAEELGLLRKGTIVLADNVVTPGAPRYREYVRGNKKFESRGVRGLIVPGDFEDELEVSKVLE